MSEHPLLARGCLTLSEGGVFINIYVQPRASKDAFAGIHGDSLKLAVTTPPVDGKANDRVIKILAKLFHISKSSILLIHGRRSRHKRLLLSGLGMDDVLPVLAAVIQV
ncbi:DUF167 domain-containing protein [Desulfobacterota bacterium M19]